MSSTPPDNTFHKRFTLDPDQRLAEDDTPSAAAFGVIDSANPTVNMIGYVCRPNLPHRLDDAGSVRGKSLNGIMQLVGFGPMMVPAAGGERLVLVYRRPAGRRLARSDNPFGARMAEDDLIERVLFPLAEGLTALHELGVTHGHIRPDMIYFAGGQQSYAVLGDYLSAPAGQFQPDGLEPIPRCATWPAGRGPASAADDFYSLGACLLGLLLGRAPTPMDDSPFEAKVSHGSFDALRGPLRPTARFAELLQGLLDDDPAHRWTGEVIERWRRGRSLPGASNTAAGDRKPFRLDGRTYRDPRLLATALCRWPRIGAAAVRSDELADWALLVVRDRAMAGALDGLRSPDHEELTGRRIDDEELTGRAAMILDPAGPIRYRDFAVAGSGLGPALAAALTSHDTDVLQNLRALIEAGLHLTWHQAHAAADPHAPTSHVVFQAQRTNLKKDGLGFGLARCLYDLNRTIPCQSTHLAPCYVVAFDSLLPALNRLARDGESATNDPLDEQIAAFIANRLNRSASDDLEDLGAGNADPARSRLAMLRILATVYGRTGRPDVHDLAKWLVARLEPVIERIHNRDLRREVGESLAKFAQAGNLSKMASLLSDKNMLKQDQAAFVTARQRYTGLRQRVDKLQNDEASRNRMVADMGLRIASYMAYGAALLSAAFSFALLGG